MKPVFPPYMLKIKLNRINGLQMESEYHVPKKRELFLRCRNSRDNVQARHYYKKYCSTLTEVINQAKKQFYHKQLATSSNKIKTAW